jgi:O-antigen ligase
MLRVISRFGVILRPLGVLATIPLSVARGIVFVWGCLRYLYHAHIHPRRLLGRVLPLALVSVVAYEIGEQILNEEPAKVIMLTIGAMFVGLVISRLYIALVLYMVLLATVIYPSAVPKPITFGGGGLGLAEILLMLILFTAYVKTYGERRHVASPMKPALVFLLFTIFLSLGVSYREYQSDPRGFYDFVAVYNAGRVLFPYALFFGILYGIRDKRELRLFFNIILGLACIVAFLMIVQYGMGKSHSIIYGDAEQGRLVVGLSDEQDVTRSIPPGLSMIGYMFLTTLYMSASFRGKKSSVYGALAAVLAAGLVLSFTRNLWIGTGAGVIGIVAVSAGQVRARLAIILVIVVASGIALSLAVSTVSPGKGHDLSKALLSRFQSISGGKVLKDENRLEENRQAWKIVQEHPIFGTGMGSTLKRVYIHNYGGPGFSTASSNIIHNSWLNIWVHYGICGLISFAWLTVVFLSRALRLWKKADEAWIRCMGLAFGVGYLVCLSRASVSMMLLAQQWDIATLSFSWGMVEIASALAIPVPESVCRLRLSESGILERKEASSQQSRHAPGPRRIADKRPHENDPACF